jgi:hypothetical protein
MKWSGARQIYVPKIGLSDGIVKAMYLENIDVVFKESKKFNMIIYSISRKLNLIQMLCVVTSIFDLTHAGGCT